MHAAKGSSEYQSWKSEVAQLKKDRQLARRAYQDLETRDLNLKNTLGKDKAADHPYGSQREILKRGGRPEAHHIYGLDRVHQVYDGTTPAQMQKLNEYAKQRGAQFANTKGNRSMLDMPDHTSN